VPRKATYLEMETTDLEFEFYLAETLRMTVTQLRRSMSAREFMQWGVYLGRKAQRKELAARG
jgi:hypothetical protein